VAALSAESVSFWDSRRTIAADHGAAILRPMLLGINGTIVDSMLLAKN
jgi:hypothetical protein